MNTDQLRQQIYEDLMRDSTQYCCYCGQAKYRMSCCGENHFETFAEMRHEDQANILDEMVIDELAKEMK